MDCVQRCGQRHGDASTSGSHYLPVAEAVILYPGLLFRAETPIHWGWEYQLLLAHSRPFIGWPSANTEDSFSQVILPAEGRLRPMTSVCKDTKGQATFLSLGPFWKLIPALELPVASAGCPWTVFHGIISFWSVLFSFSLSNCVSQEHSSMSHRHTPLHLSLFPGNLVWGTALELKGLKGLEPEVRAAWRGCRRTGVQPLPGIWGRAEKEEIPKLLSPPTFQPLSIVSQLETSQKGNLGNEGCRGHLLGAKNLT